MELSVWIKSVCFTVFLYIFYAKNNPHPLSLDTDWIF